MIAALTLLSIASAADQLVPPEGFVELLSAEQPTRLRALKQVGKHWDDAYVPMILEALRFSEDPDLSFRLITLMENETRQRHGGDANVWWTWWWNQPVREHPDYVDYKRRLYLQIDPRFHRYFLPSHTATIRWDEIRWGGVRQDGIPPLRDPAMLPAADAGYLADGDVVFGLEVNGDARAYPKRILAWHELFVDTVGDVAVAGVYCTLCGSMILYETQVAGTNHALGTSGFLYRSNKLMYDQATSSLWSTLRGEPVVGPLVGQGIVLPRRSVVTTTWGAWRERHPDTTVLDIRTGHDRDYREGAAYRAYFATDALMFPVPELDPRLANKAEVLGLRDGSAALAISAAHLAATPVLQDRVGQVGFVVFTDPSGANRVYADGGLTFSTYDGGVTATTADGTTWTLSEQGLTAADGRTLARLPAHRAFWFGWFAAFGDTRLIGA